jgi:hypothetical protein
MRCSTTAPSLGPAATADPRGQAVFYWGMYVGETEVKSDGILLVTGATVDA